MFKFIGGVLVLGIACLVGAMFEYIGGRIILPEMGLTAPEYWAWFWFTALAMVAAVVGAFVAAFVKQLS